MCVFGKMIGPRAYQPLDVMRTQSHRLLIALKVKCSVAHLSFNDTVVLRRYQREAQPQYSYRQKRYSRARVLHQDCKARMQDGQI